jgi:hypothetical protein
MPRFILTPRQRAEMRSQGFACLGCRPQGSKAIQPYVPPLRLSPLLKPEAGSSSGGSDGGLQYPSALSPEQLADTRDMSWVLKGQPPSRIASPALSIDSESSLGDYTSSEAESHSSENGSATSEVVVTTEQWKNVFDVLVPIVRLFLWLRFSFY